MTSAVNKMTYEKETQHIRIRIVSKDSQTYQLSPMKVQQFVLIANWSKTFLP